MGGTNTYTRQNSGITSKAFPTAGGVSFAGGKYITRPRKSGAETGGDWGRFGLRRSYVYGWKVLAGVVGLRVDDKPIKINRLDGVSGYTVDQKVDELRHIFNPLPIKSCNALNHQQTSYCFGPRGGSEHRKT